MNPSKPHESGAQAGGSAYPHGVFIVLDPRQSSPHTGETPHSLGVLITGEAGMGKSELALDLVSRGHALVADDAPCLRLDPDGALLGTCPAPLQDFLEVRGLGILNIRKLFGPAALREAHPLDLIIHLTAMAASEHPEQRLTGDWGARILAGRPIPTLNLPVRQGRNLALLVETAAAHHLLITRGYNAAVDLSNRLAHQLGKEPQ